MEHITKIQRGRKGVLMAKIRQDWNELNNVPALCMKTDEDHQSVMKEVTWEWVACAQTTKGDVKGGAEEWKGRGRVRRSWAKEWRQTKIFYQALWNNVPLLNDTSRKEEIRERTRKRGCASFAHFKQGRLCYAVNPASKRPNTHKA